MPARHSAQGRQARSCRIQWKVIESTVNENKLDLYGFCDCALAGLRRMIQRARLAQNDNPPPSFRTNEAKRVQPVLREVAVLRNPLSGNKRPHQDIMPRVVAESSGMIESTVNGIR